MLREFQKRDYTLRGIADQLTRRKVPTPCLFVLMLSWECVAEENTAEQQSKYDTR